MKKHPPEVDAFIRAHAPTMTARQMAAIIERETGTALDAERIHSYMSNHGIRSGHSKPRPETRITTPEVDTFIREHLPGTGPTAMAGMVNERFGTAYTAAQMKAYYARNRLNSGLTGRFEKGRASWNRGRPWSETMSPEGQAASRRTQFQPGNVPHNGGTPVGTIRVRTDRGKGSGRRYLWEKTAQPNVWRMLHILTWERANGPVPKGMLVTFADGDTMHCDPGNLVLETRAQHAVKNRLRIRGWDRESAEAANRIADTFLAIGRAKKRKGRGKEGKA